MADTELKEVMVVEQEDKGWKPRGNQSAWEFGLATMAKLGLFSNFGGHPVVHLCFETRPLRSLCMFIADIFFDRRKDAISEGLDGIAQPDFTGREINSSRTSWRT